MRCAGVPKTAEEHVWPGLLYPSVGVDDQSKGTPPPSSCWERMGRASCVPIPSLPGRPSCPNLPRTFFVLKLKRPGPWTLQSQANRDGWSHYSLPSSEFLYLGRQALCIIYSIKSHLCLLRCYLIKFEGFVWDSWLQSRDVCGVLQEESKKKLKKSPDLDTARNFVTISSY